MPASVKESAPTVTAGPSFTLVVRDLVRKIWSGLRRFVWEALEEEHKLYEKYPYGWWI